MSPSPSKLYSLGAPFLSTPSLHLLNLLKWQDEEGEEEQAFHLVHKVSAMWQQFGLVLGLTPNQLDALDRQYRGDAYLAWNRVMEHWLQGGSGGYPATWAGLYSLLRDMEYGEIAIELKAAVSKASS